MLFANITLTLCTDNYNVAVETTTAGPYNKVTAVWY